MDDVDEDRSNAGFAALSAVRRKSEIFSDDEPAFTASTSDMVALILTYMHVTAFPGRLYAHELEPSHVIQNHHPHI